MTKQQPRALFVVLCVLALLAAACSIETGDGTEDDETNEESETTDVSEDDNGDENSADTIDDDDGQVDLAQRVDQLAGHVVPISTQMMCSDYDDLEPIGAAFDDAQLVGLGEATHGTQDFNRIRNRLFEYMVKEKGFRYFILEEEVGRMIDVDRYVAFGEGDLYSALLDNNGIYWFDDYLALFTWMRSWNEANPDDLVRVHGNDAQSWRATTTYLEEILAGDAEAESALAEIRAIGENVDLLSGADPEQPPAELFADQGLDSEEAMVARNEEIRSRINAGVDVLADRLPTELDDRDRGFLELLLTNLRQYATGIDLRISWYGANGDETKIGELLNEQGDPREVALADNALAVMELEGDARKGVYYAHNEHVGRGDYGLGGPASGDMIADKIGDEYLPVFTDFFNGTLKAFDPAQQAEVLHQSGPVPDDSLAQVMEQFSADQAWLTFDSLPADDPALDWLFEQPLNQWRFGGFIFPLDDPNLSPLGTNILPERFDAVIHVKGPEHARLDPVMAETFASANGFAVDDFLDPIFLGESLDVEGCEV